MAAPAPKRSRDETSHPHSSDDDEDDQEEEVSDASDLEVDDDDEGGVMQHHAPLAQCHSPASGEETSVDAAPSPSASPKSEKKVKQPKTKKAKVAPSTPKAGDDDKDSSRGSEGDAIPLTRACFKKGACIAGPPKVVDHLHQVTNLESYLVYWNNPKAEEVIPFIELLPRNQGSILDSYQSLEVIKTLTVEENRSTWDGLFDYIIRRTSSAKDITFLTPIWRGKPLEGGSSTTTCLNGTPPTKKKKGGSTPLAPPKEEKKDDDTKETKTKAGGRGGGTPPRGAGIIPTLKGYYKKGTEILTQSKIKYEEAASVLKSVGSLSPEHLAHFKDQANTLEAEYKRNKSLYGNCAKGTSNLSKRGRGPL